MQKRPVLLLELMISLALFALIIGIVFSSFQEMMKAKSALKQDKETILREQKLQLRLAQIFSASIKVEEKGEGYFLTYDNRLDPDSEFRGKLDGMLYIDERKRLAFVTWGEKQIRKEILYEPATSLTLSFFDEAKKSWDPKYPNQRPFMMKVELKDLTIPIFL